jgi:hypothetical protein
MATEDNALTPQEQAKLKAFAQGLPDNPGDIDVDAIAQQTGTSRRQVLQIIAAVGVGSIAGGVSVSQLVSKAQAQASTSDSDGNVGTPSDRVDVFADGVDASVIDTEKIGTSQRYASAFDGADPDARLDNALSAASNGDIIYLEAGDYTSNRTISTKCAIIGPQGFEIPPGGASFNISGDWTFGAEGALERVVLSSNTITFTEPYSYLDTARSASGGSIVVDADHCRVLNMAEGSVTFNSGTKQGLVDSSTNVAVTDNGTNTTGDIA